MPRSHLIEIEDQSWCPRPLRDALTDLLGLNIRRYKIYEPVAPLLGRAMRAMDVNAIVDLCSGGGGPWPGLLERLPKTELLLTDLYPNVAAFEAVSTSTPQIQCSFKPVNAMCVPSDVTSFRTLFTALHHFQPSQVRAIISDAVSKNVGIGAFEFTRRTPQALAFHTLGWLMAFLSVPRVRPLRWSYLFWTYLLPALPLLATLDGVVSCWRTYSEEELRAFTLEWPHYDWQIGSVYGPKWPIPITYFIGIPNRHDRHDLLPR